MKEIGELGNSNSSEGFLALFFSTCRGSLVERFRILIDSFPPMQEEDIVLKLDHRKLTNGYQKLWVLEHVSWCHFGYQLDQTWKDFGPLCHKRLSFFVGGGRGQTINKGALPKNMISWKLLVWKTTLPFGMPSFEVRTLTFREGTLSKSHGRLWCVLWVVASPCWM